MDNIKLNDEQNEVVFSDFNTSKIISAPPGAGKTTVMAKRISFLINQGYIKHPHKILALTFSNAAANEMRKKISDEMRFTKNLFHITTFHGFCFDVLKGYGNYIGLTRNFEIYTYKNNYNPRLKHAFEHFGLNYDKEEFNKWKLNYVLKCKKNDNEKFLRVLKYYYSLLIENNMIDFDGLLIYTYKLFKKCDNILEYYRSPFKIILIDEFQDTNSLQFKILDLLVKGNEKNNKKNIFIFTDPKQSIYGFQGAAYKNHELAIENFNCLETKLTECHRFENKAIEQLSRSISNYIDGNREENSESTIKDNLPKYYIFNKNRDEYEFIINKINDLNNNGVKYENICILAPNGKILYKLNHRMKRLKFKNFIFIQDYKDKWDAQITRLNNLSKIDLSEYSNLYDLFNSNSNKQDYFKDVILKESKKTDKKFPNLEIKDRLSNFINHIVLNEDNLIKNNFFKDKVFLSTIHGSKGLQFDISFVCGLNNDYIPFYTDCRDKCYEKTGVLNKESLNLLNVAVSRSKKQLYLSSLDNNKTHKTCILKPFYRYLEIVK